MLRAVVALALLAFVGGLAFYLGRSSVTPLVASAPAPSSPPVGPEQTRARSEAVPPNPTLPQPPVVTPGQELAPPPNPLPRQAAPTPEPAPPGETPLGDASGLYGKSLGAPIPNLKREDVQDTFNQARGGGERRHEATDIMAPKGTPVIAVDTGIIAKLFTSKAGGLTIYQFDPTQRYAYYYAHLDRYAEGLREGMLVKKGDRIGYVGVTGNSDPNAPHLHFTIFELGPEKRWWEGKPINPYEILLRTVTK